MMETRKFVGKENEMLRYGGKKASFGIDANRRDMTTQLLQKNLHASDCSLLPQLFNARQPKCGDEQE